MSEPQHTKKPAPLFEQAPTAAMPAPTAAMPIPPALPPAPLVPVTPLELWAQAIDKGFDADQLDKLLTLHERWNRARAEEAYNEAMRACQQELPQVIRNKRNLQTKSWYANLDGINAAATPVYTRHGFALSFSEGETPLAGHKRTVCQVLHRGGHHTTHYIDLPLDGFGAKGNVIGAMNPVQAAISTGTYGQRVLLCRVFNITIVDSDQDGQRAETFTEAEVKEVEDLIDGIRAAGWDVQMDRILMFGLGVDTPEEINGRGLADLPRSRFAEMRRALKEQLAEAQRKQAAKEKQ